MEVNEDTSMSITSSPEDFENIKNVLVDKEIIVEGSEIAFIPENTVEADLDTSLKVFKLLETLEELDDTQTVTSNVDFSDEMLEHLD
jgi:transcriptional/translational regulatory protein YebC/TACO1